MKLTLCTLAICLSILAAVLTLKETIRSESKRTRAAVPKALTEPLDANKDPDSVVRKLDAVQAQLSSLGKRLAQLEAASAGRPAPASSQEKGPDPLLAEVQALAAGVRGISADLAKLDGVPAHLTGLTTYLDQSFEHLEKSVAQTSTPDELLVAIDWLVQRVDDIDHYFTPLYAFLGVVYDPDNEELLKAYPSIDVRINALIEGHDALKKEVSDIRYMLTPRVREPTKYQR